MEQPQYSMLHRTFVERDYLPLFENFGMGTTIWSPLASGLLTDKYFDGSNANEKTRMDLMAWLKERALGDMDKVDKVKKLYELSREIGIPLAHLGLCWCLKNKNVSTVILGASKVSQLEQNLKCFDSLPKVTDEVMQRIDTILQNKPTLVVY
jgi:aryl-alcohol dehydrogenase-like predicted oxidoreductase